MKVKLKFFGQLAEITGTLETEISGIGNTDLLTKKIINDFPGLQHIKFQIAVNKKLIQGNQQLEPGSEVAFLPPYAGG